MQTHCYGFQIHTYNTLPVFGDSYFICKHSVGENISIQDTIVGSLTCFFSLQKIIKSRIFLNRSGLWIFR